MELNYRWKLADAYFQKNKGKVFSCFACGGGSTMGYKLAGFDVIGCNEIDPKMMEAYKTNHNPKYAYLSSSAVKEVASLNGCIKDLVPKEIEEDIIKSFNLSKRNKKALPQ